jgi:hypothetical protein
LGARKADLDEEFRDKAEKVFAQFGDPRERAVQDAKMMWLAWRGDDRFVQVHLSDQVGLESSWRFCKYTEVPSLVERYKYVEARPMRSPFTEHVLASLTALFQRLVSERIGARVYSLSLNGDTAGLTQDGIDAGRAYKYASEGFEIVADWPKEPRGVLKSRSISLSQERFLYFDFVHKVARATHSERGFAQMLARQERASARRRRKSLLKWIVSG